MNKNLAYQRKERDWGKANSSPKRIQPVTKEGHALDWLVALAEAARRLWFDDQIYVDYTHFIVILIRSLSLLFLILFYFWWNSIQKKWI